MCDTSPAWILGLFENSKAKISKVLRCFTIRRWSSSLKSLNYCNHWHLFLLGIHKHLRIMLKYGGWKKSRESPVDMVNIPLFAGWTIHPEWCRISSINSMLAAIHGSCLSVLFRTEPLSRTLIKFGWEKLHETHQSRSVIREKLLVV